MRQGRHVSRRVARRRAVATVVTAAVGAAAWAGTTYWPRGSVGTAPPTSQSTGTTGTTPPTTSTTTSTPTTSAPAGDGPVGVGTYGYAKTTLQLVEPATKTLPARSLPTTIWYPHAKGAPGTAPDRAGRPYPLLFFSQGFFTPVTTYATLLADWASAGYVVVAPTYPTTDPQPAAETTRTKAELEESDIVHHPGDLRYVITQVLAKAGHAGWPLSGLVDTTEVGLVGQSDGANVSLAVADNSTYRDPVVKAVADLSGAELASFGGTYFSNPPVPLLVVQSNADPVNLPACSVQVYDQAPDPKWYLQLQGPTGLPTWEIHLGPYTSLTSYEQVIANVTTYFFDAELAGQHGALADMAQSGAAAGLTELSSGPTAPTPPGKCPTKP